MDRIFAMWQILYPDQYVERMRAVSQSFTVSVGDVQDVNSPLEPFSSDTRDTKFTPKDVRSTLRFEYTYPETSRNASSSAVKRAINKLYGSNASVGGPVKRAGYNVSGENENDKPSTGMLANGRLRHYLANIVSQKFAVNGSYAIYFFLGDFEDNPSAWPISKNLAGTHAVAASMTWKFSANARPAAVSKVKVTSAVPLTDLLQSKMQAGELASMEIENVEAYPSEHLQWRVATFDATAIACEDVADLSIIIVSIDVRPSAAEAELPQWGEFTRLNVAQEEQCRGR